MYYIYAIEYIEPIGGRYTILLPSSLVHDHHKILYRIKVTEKYNIEPSSVIRVSLPTDYVEKQQFVNLGLFRLQPKDYKDECRPFSTKKRNKEK